MFDDSITDGRYSIKQEDVSAPTEPHQRHFVGGGGSAELTITALKAGSSSLHCACQRPWDFEGWENLHECMFGDVNVNVTVLDQVRPIESGLDSSQGYDLWQIDSNLEDDSGEDSDDDSDDDSDGGGHASSQDRYSSRKPSYDGSSDYKRDNDSQYGRG